MKSVAYIVFPSNRMASLINIMNTNGLVYIEDVNKISIEYAKPPKIVRVNGKDAIQLFKFTF